MSMPPCPCLHVHVSMSPCINFSMFQCLHVYVSMLPCLHLNFSMSPCLHVFMSPCHNVLMFPQTENVTSGKRQLPFVFCKRKTETANLRFVAANVNGKQKFVFLGRQTINGNRRLLFQITCPSMLVGILQSLYCTYVVCSGRGSGGGGVLCTKRDQYDAMHDS
jgi:hypothetical protein